jgi:hypothetical protein
MYQSSANGVIFRGQQSTTSPSFSLSCPSHTLPCPSHAPPTYHNALCVVPSANTTVPQTFAVEPMNVTTAMVGSKVILECAGRGYPTPTESWTKLERTFPMLEHVTSTGELVIDSVIPEQAGTYACRIRDKNGTLIDERRVELIVRGERGHTVMLCNVEVKGHCVHC